MKGSEILSLIDMKTTPIGKLPLGKLLIAFLLFFVQIGLSYSIQSEAAPIALPLLMTFLYGVLCGSHILGFLVGFLSSMAYPVAVVIFYSLQGYPMEILGSFLVYAFLGFFFLGIIFGIVGVVSVKIGQWFRKKLAD